MNTPQLPTASGLFTGGNFTSYLVGPGLDGDKLSARGTAAPRGSEMS